jgi:hypothetical protein
MLQEPEAVHARRELIDRVGDRPAEAELRNKKLQLTRIGNSKTDPRTIATEGKQEMRRIEGYDPRCGDGEESASTIEEVKKGLSEITVVKEQLESACFLMGNKANCALHPNSATSKSVRNGWPEWRGGSSRHRY